MSFTIRGATPADIGDILRLVKALAVFENEADKVLATGAMLHERLFGPDARVSAHVAEQDGAVVGIAVWFLNFSTWTGRYGIYLEDLFVDVSARRLGIARAFFATLAAEARARGCARLDWAVLDWNESAKGFYRSLGGFRNEGWEPWRLEGAALDALAAEAGRRSAAAAQDVDRERDHAQVEDERRQ